MSVWAVLADILYVGHSLVGPTLPQMVEAGLAQMGQPAVVHAQIINGAPLRYQWDNSTGAEGVDARAELARGTTGALILTEAIPLAAQVEWNDSAGRVAAFAGLARETNPEVRVYLYETWHSLASAPGAVVPDDPGAGVAWRARLEADLPQWQDVAARAEKASGVPVALIPAGQAMGRLADAIADGAVPGLDTIRDVFADDIHPNGKGFYFVAMVHLASLTGRSPEGLPAKLTRAWPSRDAVMTDETARAMQRIAWEAVQAYQATTTRPGATGLADQSPQPDAQDSGEAQPEVTPKVAVKAVAPAGPPAAAPDFVPEFAPITNRRLSLGLAGVNDWSVQQPFLDIMKTARPWTGHLPGQWGGWDHDRLVADGALDPQGWPLRLPAGVTGISTLILTDLPEDAYGVAGRYLVTWTGQADVAAEGRATLVDRAPGRLRFDYTPGDGAVILTLASIDPADPIRDIVVVREDRAAALAAGAMFNPDWLARIRGVQGVRFMDWMMTNNSALSSVKDRPRPTDYTWARIGVPMEIMVALANELDADPWFTIPHLADDALVREMAVAAKVGLEPGLRAHVEFSNEVWNWQFAQAVWAEAEGRARWGKDTTWVQFYALRAAEVAGIWAEVFGVDAKDRLVRVIATQTGWKGLEEQILDAPLVIGEGKPAPAKAFDAYAVTGYFSGGLASAEKVDALRGWLAESQAAAEAAATAKGLSGAAAAAHVQAHRFDLAETRAAAEMRSGATTGVPTDTLDALLADTLPYHAAVAARHDLRLVMYEGGTHAVGLGPLVDADDVTAFLTHFNFSDEMGALYDDLLAGWARVSDAPFNAFVDVYRPGKWGSWGALRHLGDENPRWRALAAGCKGC